jgi:peptide/nickel transport system permease protein
MAPTLETALIGRTLIGLGVSVTFISMLKIIAVWFEENRFASVTGVTVLLGNLGSVLAGVPLAMMAQSTGWRVVFIGVGVISLVLAVGLAWVRGSSTDRGTMVLFTGLMSVSILVFIILGQNVLAYRLGWFPVQGWSDDFWKNITTFAPLPILLGLLVSIAPNTRLFRSFVLDEVDQDYVRTARAKGMSEARVMFVHVLRNALIPVITFVISNLPGLLLGAFLLERFFGIPGVGREIILAVERSDFPVIKAVTIYVAIATMFFNLIGDVLYRITDPRVQLR